MQDWTHPLQGTIPSISCSNSVSKSPSTESYSNSRIRAHVGIQLQQPLISDQRRVWLPHRKLQTSPSSEADKVVRLPLQQPVNQRVCNLWLAACKIENNWFISCSVRSVRTLAHGEADRLVLGTCPGRPQSLLCSIQVDSSFVVIKVLDTNVLPNNIILCVVSVTSSDQERQRHTGILQDHFWRSS